MVSYICPICKNKLHRENASFVCANRHTFDVAKEGYVNLLPVNRKNNLDPGDNREMAAAREQFLSEGYFDKLAQTLVSIVSRSEAKTLLDVGSGTGYYTRRMPIEHYGVDISKHAVRIASMKDKEGRYAVASVFSLPFAEPFDALLNCFAPKAPEEYRRVLKEEGLLIEVVPGRDHLIELKERMYENVRYNEEKPAIEGFSLAECERLRYRTTVKRRDVANLLAMTPYRYKTKPNAFTCLDSDLETTFDFLIRTWKR